MRKPRKGSNYVMLSDGDFRSLWNEGKDSTAMAAFVRRVIVYAQATLGGISPNRGSRSASPPAALLISSWERQTMSKSGPASRKINAEPCSSGFSMSLIALLHQRAQAFDRRRFGHFRPMIASSTLATANPEPETTNSTDCRKGPHVGRGRQQI